MRSDLTQDLYLLELAVVDHEELRAEYEKVGCDEVALAIKYNVPLKEMMDKLAGASWFLPEMTYFEKLKWLSQHRVQQVQKYCDQILALRRNAIGDREYWHRTRVLKILLEQGRSLSVVNRIYSGKPFVSTYQFDTDQYKVKQNYAQSAIARMLEKQPYEYKMMIKVREELFSGVTSKLHRLLSHLATYMNLYGIAKYLGWDRARVRRQLQQMGIVPIVGRIYTECNDRPDRVGGGKWDYMIGRVWADGTMRVLYPLGFRKAIEGSATGNTAVILADSSIFTDDLYLSRYHVVYYRVKCDRCGWEMNLAHHFIMNNGHCPICLERRRAQRYGRQPNYKKFGYKGVKGRTLLGAPPSDGELPYIDGDEPPEVIELMKEAIAEGSVHDGC